MALGPLSLHTVKVSFGAGEFAPSLYARTDVQRYSIGARRLRNMIVHPHGGVSNRPGMKYTATGKYDGKKIRLIPFEYSITQNYVIEFGDYYARFFNNGVPITSGAYTKDFFTKLLLHFDTFPFTDETGKSVTNSSVKELDYMEYATDLAAQTAYVTNTLPGIFLCHFDGSNNDTSDTPELGPALTFHNTAALDSSYKKFGATSLHLTNQYDHVSFTADSNFDFGTGDFGLDLIFKPSANTDNWLVYFGNDLQIYWYYGSGQYFSIKVGSTIYYPTPNFRLTVGQVYHIYLCRISGVVKVFIDGTQVGTDQTITDDIDLTGVNCLIGTQFSTGYNAYGWIDEFHVTKTPQWSSNFTPPTSAYSFYLQSSSESTTKSQGSYALKGVAEATNSLNKTLTKTISSPIDLTDISIAHFDIYSSRTGSNIKIGIHDSGGTTTEITPNVIGAGAWQTVSWDLSGVSNANKDAIDSIIITIVNADSDNTFYIDNFFSGSGVSLSTSHKVLGAGAGYFDGNASLTFSASSDFNLESADFTYEKFIEFASLSDQWLCGNGATSAGGWGLKYDNTAHTLAFWANGASRATVSFTPTAGVVYHICVERCSGVVKLAIDGSFGAGSNYATSITSIYDFTEGKDSQTATNLFNGYSDEAQFSKGIAYYKGVDFTPPSSSNIPYEIVTPYGENDLDDIDYTQSADVLYLAHPLYAPQELARITNTDWTLNDYNFTGGPFMLDNTDTTKTVAASAVTGSGITLTAVGFTFQSTHVGALWQLSHDIPNQAVSYSGSSTSTSIKCGGTWRLITHGTWTGKIRIEKSTDGGTTWTSLREFTSSGDINFNTYGTEDMSNNAEPFLIRINCYSGSVATADLTSDGFVQIGIARITAVAVGGATATADVERTIGSTDATPDWAEGAWSDYRGWPAHVEFHPEDRIVFANTTTEPRSLWTTKTSNYISFMRSNPLVDSDGITVPVPSRKVNGINGLVPLSELIVLTAGCEASLRASSGALSPTTAKMKISGWDGAASVKPVAIGNRALYVQALGEVVRDLGYDLYSDSFTGSDLTVFSNHLFKGYSVKEMAYQQNPDRLIWTRRDDGKFLSLTYMREQEVVAWTWHDTGENGADEIESICSIPASGYNEVYFSVKRGTARYIERMVQRMASTAPEDQYFLDCGGTYDSTATDTVTDVDWLNGKDIAILADGVVVANPLDSSLPVVTVADGSFTLPGGITASVIQYGLPYTSEVETLNIEVGLSDGTIQGKVLKVSQLVLRVVNSRGGYIGIDSSSLHPLRYDSLKLASALALFTGDIKEILGNSYSEGGRTFFRQIDPLPITILGFFPTVTVGGITPR